MTLQEIRRRLAVHNIGVATNVLCPFTISRKWRYGTHPIGRGGSHNHFSSKDDLCEFLLQVEKVAYWNELYPLKI